MTKRSRLVIWALSVTSVGAVAWFGYRAFSKQAVTQETDRLAGILALDETSRVADVGAGDASFSIELASRIVPRGHVFATEIEEESVANIQARGSALGLSNLTGIRAGDASTHLPPECCDAVFLRGVYHHITNPAETNRSLRESLRPNGRLAIIDFEPSWFLSTFFPVRNVPASRGGHGIPPTVVAAEVEAAGFKLVRRIDDWTRGQYCLVFENPAPGS